MEMETRNARSQAGHARLHSLRGLGSTALLHSHLPGSQDGLFDLLHADVVLHRGEDRGAVTAHGARVPAHHLEVGAHSRGKVHLVDHEEVRLRDAGASLAGHLVSAGDVDDVDGEVRKLAREVGRQVVASALAEQELHPFVLRRDGLKGQEVGRDVLADGRVRATACLDGVDSLRGQRAVPREELCILAREDVVGDDAQGVPLAQRLAELQGQGGLPRADRPADAHGERPGPPVARRPERVGALRVEPRVLHVLMAVPVTVAMPMAIRMVPDLVLQSGEPAGKAAACKPTSTPDPGAPDHCQNSAREAGG
mmetsp:Transcript_13598/g.38688  ORF Transcript_13598/g.38688 Transcript_13598/m.38688 type:complete len:310 (-) Transcript_13598:39-968(-)